MNTWYTRLMFNTEIASNGAVALQLKELVKTGLFSGVSDPKSLDANIAGDVSTWFHIQFKPWFMALSTLLGPESDRNQLVSPQYIFNINEITKALFVARSFYATKADEAFMTSIKDVAKYQALFCEELAAAVNQAYANSIVEYGLMPKEAATETEASSYEGSTPENFNWPGTVLSYHSKIKNVESTQQTTEQIGCPGNGNSQYLPWVFTAAFGLIAWAAAAKKPDSNRK